MIQGVELHPMKHISVPKGDIFHAIHSTDEGYAGFGEAYFSEIQHGMVKGWKRHNRMVLNIVVPVRADKLGVYDEHEASQTRRQFHQISH